MKKSDLNNEIRRCYPTEDSDILAKRLGLTVNNLRRKAARMGIKKIRATITNEIVNNKKLCPKCCKIKDVSQFNKDKYQPNDLDYWCRECREKARKKSIETVQKDSLLSSKVSKNGSMSFGIKKTHNPIIKVLDLNGNLVDGLKCKGDYCNHSEKPLTEYYPDVNNSNGHKNICKYCMKKKREQNKRISNK